MTDPAQPAPLLPAPPTPPDPHRPTPRWVLHLIVGGCALLIALLVVIAADIYVHYRLAPYAAVNIWGYRGELLGRKKDGEKRILMIGPSTVFSVGFPPHEALPAHLERQLQQRVSFPVRVPNLGMPGEDAYAYRANLEDFRFLKPDAVIFYGDSNPTGRAAPVVLRRDSPIFRMTGYYPMLHIAIRERWLLWKNDGKFAPPDGENKVVFRPGDAERSGAGALTGAAAVADYVEKTLGERAGTAGGTCANEFRGFCTAMNDAVTYARSLGLPVLVVNQPYERAFQVQIQEALQVMLREQHGHDSGVRYLDLGRAIDLTDTALTYDGVHLTPAGNATMAGHLVEPAMALLKR